MEIKQLYDPENIFHLNQNIRGSKQAGGGRVSNTQRIKLCRKRIGTGRFACQDLSCLRVAVAGVAAHAWYTGSADLVMAHISGSAPHACIENLCTAPTGQRRSLRCSGVGAGDLTRTNHSAVRSYPEPMSGAIR